MHLRNLRTLEARTLTTIRQTLKSKHNTPSQTRLLIVELVRIRKQLTRLTTSRAQPSSKSTFTYPMMAWTVLRLAAPPFDRIAPNR